MARASRGGGDGGRDWQNSSWSWSDWNHHREEKHHGNTRSGWSGTASEQKNKRGWGKNSNLKGWHKEAWRKWRRGKQKVENEEAPVENEEANVVEIDDSQDDESEGEENAPADADADADWEDDGAPPGQWDDVAVAEEPAASNSTSSQQMNSSENNQPEGSPSKRKRRFQQSQPFSSSGSTPTPSLTVSSNPFAASTPPAQSPVSMASPAPCFGIGQSSPFGLPMQQPQQPQQQQQPFGVGDSSKASKGPRDGGGLSPMAAAPVAPMGGQAHPQDRLMSAGAAAISSFLANPDCSGLPAPGATVREGIVGTLDAMCSQAEIQDRIETRQLDMFEMASGSTLEAPLANHELAAKKYGRSSADKQYLPDDIRTLPACTRTLRHLMCNIIDADRFPPEGACSLTHGADYWKVYSFLRDRTRAIRVDLTLQQWSTSTRVFIVVLEICLRFEILSMYLLQTKVEYLQKYDEKMAQKSCSQVLEPLLGAYQQARERHARGQRAYMSPSEPATLRFIILLLLVGGDREAVWKHLPSFPKEMLEHKVVAWAIDVATAYETGNSGRFMKRFKEADFLSATILLPLVNVVRRRVLWMMVRSIVPPPRHDKLVLSQMRQLLDFADDASTAEFLQHHGLVLVEYGTGATMVHLPGYDKQLRRWTHTAEGTQSQDEAFNDRLGSNSTSEPTTCDFPRRPELSLQSKYERLPCNRTGIVFGDVDPLLAVPSGASQFAASGTDQPALVADAASPFLVQTGIKRPGDGFLFGRGAADGGAASAAPPSVFQNAAFPAAPAVLKQSSAIPPVPLFDALPWKRQEASTATADATSPAGAAFGQAFGGVRARRPLSPDGGDRENSLPRKRRRPPDALGSSTLSSIPQQQQGLQLPSPLSGGEGFKPQAAFSALSAPPLGGAPTINIDQSSPAREGGAAAGASPAHSSKKAAADAQDADIEAGKTQGGEEDSGDATASDDETSGASEGTSDDEGDAATTAKGEGESMDGGDMLEDMPLFPAVEAPELSLLGCMGIPRRMREKVTPSKNQDVASYSACEELLAKSPSLQDSLLRKSEHDFWQCARRHLDAWEEMEMNGDRYQPPEWPKQWMHSAMPSSTIMRRSVPSLRSRVASRPVRALVPRSALRMSGKKPSESNQAKLDATKLAEDVTPADATMLADPGADDGEEKLEPLQEEKVELNLYRSNHRAAEDAITRQIMKALALIAPLPGTL